MKTNQIETTLDANTVQFSKLLDFLDNFQLAHFFGTFTIAEKLGERSRTDEISIQTA